MRIYIYICICIYINKYTVYMHTLNKAKACCRIWLVSQSHSAWCSRVVYRIFVRVWTGAPFYMSVCSPTLCEWSVGHLFTLLEIVETLKNVTFLWVEDLFGRTLETPGRHMGFRLYSLGTPHAIWSLSWYNWWFLIQFAWLKESPWTWQMLPLQPSQMAAESFQMLVQDSCAMSREW